MRQGSPKHTAVSSSQSMKKSLPAERKEPEATGFFFWLYFGRQKSDKDKPRKTES